MMQQTVLLTAIRGPDGIPKYGAVKMLLRWFRRCSLISALDGMEIADPADPRGGSFTGPSIAGPADGWELEMNKIVDQYLREVDAMPHHFHLHLMHAIEILGYKHPAPRIRAWWNAVYMRMVGDFHLLPETQDEMDRRLGDDRLGWLARADPATCG